nr:DUF3047 domain-containing protein [Oxalobacteraceae bacterium]
MKSKLFIIHTENQANIFVLGFAIFLLLFSTITRAAVFVSNFDNVTPPTLSIPPSWQIIRLETHTSRAQMVVLRTGNSDSGKWMAERVNVLDDLHRSFGTLRGKLKLLAIASDSDNTKEKARAGFAEIAFVKSFDQWWYLNNILRGTIL